MWQLVAPNCSRIWPMPRHRRQASGRNPKIWWPTPVGAPRTQGERKRPQMQPCRHTQWTLHPPPPQSLQREKARQNLIGRYTRRKWARRICRVSIGRVCVTLLTPPPPDCQRASETACVPHFWCFATLYHLMFLMPAIHSGWVANWGNAWHAAQNISPFSYFSQGCPDCQELWNARTLVVGGQGGQMGSTQWRQEPS